MKDKKQKATMSLVGHLTEIRNRLALCLVALILVFLVSFFFIRSLADTVLNMGSTYGFHYVYLAPSELLSSYFKLSLLISAVIVAPFLVFELWRFVSPALRPVDKKAILPALFGGFGFFLLGAVFAYVVALPFMIQFLVSYNQSTLVQSSISVASYFDFIVGMLIVFGIVFEMPMLAYALSRLGILSPKLMRKVRRYFIPCAFLLAAIITPPDVASQFMVAVPMLGLYEVSIFISMFVSRRRQQREEEEDAEAESILSRLFGDDDDEADEPSKKEDSASTHVIDTPEEDDEEFFG